MIEWNDVDLLTCFEAEPEIGDGRREFTYVTKRSGYTLTFTLCPSDEDIHVVLNGPSQTSPSVEAWLHGCRQVRYERTGEVESLLFKYRDEDDRPYTYHSAVLRVRPEFSFTITRN